MTQTHTLGPWKIILMDYNIERATVGRTKNRIVATIESAESTAADARLIAAAPELLEALEWAIQHAPAGAARDRVQRIIAKARRQA